MDSLPLTPSAALKLVELYQLAHDINQIHQDQLFIQRQNDLLYGQILEQKVTFIFHSTSTKIFMEGLQDLIIFIDERLAIKPSKYPEITAALTEKLLALKNILIQIQEQSNTQNV
ncbi:MAG TPA: hypothetical protein VK169_05765 [Saprospiraceae bacterium]|nr:hypothetical protein [Saprospiraceae bacterium]